RPELIGPRGPVPKSVPRACALHFRKSYVARPTFVTISKNGSNPAYRGARIGMDRLALLRGVRVQHLVPVVDDSIAEQAEMLDELARRRPDAVLISCAHHSELD